MVSLETIALRVHRELQGGLETRELPGNFLAFPLWSHRGTVMMKLCARVRHRRKIAGVDPPKPGCN